MKPGVSKPRLLLQEMEMNLVYSFALVVKSCLTSRDLCLFNAKVVSRHFRKRGRTEEHVSADIEFFVLRL